MKALQTGILHTASIPVSNRRFVDFAAAGNVARGFAFFGLFESMVRLRSQMSRGKALFLRIGLPIWGSSSTGTASILRKE